MREQLEQYVNLLFAGAADAEDIKQEILQNTLDRYDDLVAQGKVPEAAYRLAIAGIGDINEILGTKPLSSPAYSRAVKSEQEPEDENKKPETRRPPAFFVYAFSSAFSSPNSFFSLQYQY